jgi:AcrR family transcriptional regulator
MARRSQLYEKRRELLPIVARTFAELGYRRTTTAELARRCEVQENILYRLWPDKKAMFVAAINYVYELSVDTWQRLLRDDGDGCSPAERLLTYESEHHGEFGYYRIVFAGLSETDDSEVREALADMYRKYQRFIEREIAGHRQRCGQAGGVSALLAAWAVVCLGTVTSIARELGLLGERQRHRLFRDVGQLLLSGVDAPASKT